MTIRGRVAAIARSSGVDGSHGQIRYHSVAHIFIMLLEGIGMARCLLRLKPRGFDAGVPGSL